MTLQHEHAKGPLEIDQLAEFVPGALFRYRVLPYGSDRVEHMSSGCRSQFAGPHHPAADSHRCGGCYRSDDCQRPSDSLW